MSAPAGALAQVIVDPDSPAGKEYAIPLEEARDQGSGSGGGSGTTGSSGGGSSDLFGEGIAAAEGTTAAAAPDASGKGSATKGAVPDRRGSKPQTTTSTPTESADNIPLGAAGSASPGGGGLPWVLVIGSALAVLAAGGLVAAGMRGRQRATPS